MKSLKRPGKHYPLSANQRVVKTNYSYQLRWTNTTEHDQDDGDDVGDNDEENCDDDDENHDDAKEMIMVGLSFFLISLLARSRQHIL